MSNVKIKDLIPDDANFNTGTEFGNALIEKSLTKFGAGRSVLLDKNNRIIAGNKTIENAAANGFDNVQIVETDGKTIIAVKRTDVDLNTKKGREMALADNATAKANIEWNFEALTDWEMPAQEWGITFPEIIEEPGDADAEPQIDKAAELNKKWKVQAGDLWSIGEHRLLCGDSTKQEDVDHATDGGKVQVTFTDPPYNVDYGANNNPRHKRTIENDNLGEDFPAFITLVLSLVLSKTEGAIYICMSDKEWARMFGILESLDAHWSSTIVWVKDQLVLSPKDYHSRHELIWYGWAKDGRRLPLADRTQTDIWECDRPKRSDEHPTMKPVPLVQKAIANSSKVWQKVYEPFAGSGTTLVACQNLNRKCYAIEISENYCAVILERMSTAFPDLEIKRIEDAKGKATN